MNSREAYRDIVELVQYANIDRPQLVMRLESDRIITYYCTQPLDVSFISIVVDRIHEPVEVLDNMYRADVPGNIFLFDRYHFDDGDVVSGILFKRSHENRTRILDLQSWHYAGVV